MKFSQRIGKNSVREIAQIESIDSKLENRLWNAILTDFFNHISNYSGYKESSDREKVCEYIWTEFFDGRVDEIPGSNHNGLNIYMFIDYLKNWFFESKWYEKYDLLEFLCRLDKKYFRLNFSNDINLALEKELSGYRIIDNSIAQITNRDELNEIEEALTYSSKWSSVETHLKTSIEYFSNRENPDYRNSIKEAISAVEAFCCIVTDDNDATLGKALLLIEEKFKIHKALKSAFSALYGYTSDSGGIRHSLLEDDILVSIEDAKFMLVSCTAFINYLKSKIAS